MSHVLGQVEDLREQCREALAKIGSLAALQEERVRFLGKKGEITRLLRMLGTLSPEERPRVGSTVNELRDEMEMAFEAAKMRLEVLEAEKEEERGRLDVTLPCRGRGWGSFHPVVQVMHEVIDVFLGLGYSVALGPEIEDDFHNFEALNIPSYHPARDMQDTFYVEGNRLLRTHTSPVQVRSMLRWGAPLRIICPGKVFRRDSDPTHSPMFHQLEGLLVDRDVSIADLKGSLEAFAKAMFGPEVKARYRASYFPFTEPSMEMDVSCVACGGKNPSCRICKGSGWLEISGLGMVHPNVLRAGGIDPTVYNGFAWGMGLDRIALLKYDVRDLRFFFDGDVTFLSRGGMR
ncbi:phenylalanine--tRNA ligase subunit alpha [Aminiphilus sp.]|jgi:phenylalanyl-tRNA synthetase alpha chain|uniref:phenylalanine--tRNA ligase subunit alpha n=1 Tax=Aminiphilus sp. TaxID=1872488 RepID=UPI002608179C|nr:phenylalanine--tRNA ligase subunit alpha [Aminiphilus sp.]